MENSLTKTSSFVPPKTGESVTLFYARNKESSTLFAQPAGMDFGQRIEPSGEYMVVEQSTPLKAVNERWEAGSISFSNPLVLEHKSTDSHGWKKDLSVMFGSKTGRVLASAIVSAGYDAVLTVTGTEMSECVNYSGIKIVSPKENSILVNATNEPVQSKKIRPK
jgi:hypothetical protein